MLTEETKKKIGFLVLIIAVIIGVLFVLFAVVLNRGTITIEAAAPFTIEIRNLKDISCPQSPCSAVVAPGEYIIILTKQGYKDINYNIEVPIFGEYKKEVKFAYVPAINQVSGSDLISAKFSGPVLKDASLKDSKIFFDDGGKNLVYLQFDSANKKQTLYSQPNAENGNTQKTAITSFVRPLSDYLIFADLTNQKQIALIDRGNNQSTLYLIDLAEKSRNSLFSYPIISELKWLPNSKNFLFSARPEGQINQSLFLYDAVQKKPVLLDLKTTLKNILPLSSDRLIAATGQMITGLASLDQSQGQLVTLGENTATPEVQPGVTSQVASAPPITSFIDYTISGMQSRLILAAPDFSLPESIILNETGHGIYFQIGTKVYELIFEE